MVADQSFRFEILRQEELEIQNLANEPSPYLLKHKFPLIYFAVLYGRLNN